MSKEAMKLALEALEIEDSACRYIKDTTPDHIDKAITALREALANEALDKMAENARELGLDYGPARLPFGVGGGLVAIKTLLSRDPCVHANTAIQMIDAILAEQPAQQEPVAWMQDSIELYVQDRPSEYYTIPLYTSPPAQRKPLHIGEETAAFKAWFDAWWIGDGEQGETIPTQSDKHFLTYLDQYTLGFGAWMAAKHAAHGIKENT